MARRSDHTREEIRQLVIDAAVTLIGNEGLKAMSARKIASEIGYTPGTLYLVFKNLDEIILTANAETLDIAFSRMESSIKRTRNPENRLLRLAHTYIDDVLERERLWNAVYEHRLPAGCPVPQWYQQKIDNIFQLIENEIATLLSGKQSTQRKNISRALWSCVHGASVLQLQGKFANSTREFRESVETGVRLILKGATC